MSVNREGIITMLTALMEHPCSIKDLVKITGFQRTTLDHWIADLCKLRNDKRMIHRCGWERTKTGNPCIALYKFGHGTMARRPPKQTAAQRQARLRERKKLARLHGVPIHAVVYRVQ